MKLIRFLILFVFLSLFALSVNAQRTEITISLSEQFFDTVIDALFQSGAPPEFAIAKGDLQRRDAETRSGKRPQALSALSVNSFADRKTASSCKESIRLRRESEGVKTAVRFREGKIIAPLAFDGSYDPPLIGCVDFSGWAETVIDLEFDQATQRFLARARVTKVSLNGASGIGGNLIARLVQNAIDKRINPIEIVRMDKISFLLPIQNSGNLRMKAVGVRHSIQSGLLNVQIAYELSRD